VQDTGNSREDRQSVLLDVIDWAGLSAQRKGGTVVLPISGTALWAYCIKWSHMLGAELDARRNFQVG
jgi:hypothetical protein